MTEACELGRVQLPRHICTRLGRFLCSWIIMLNVDSRDPMVFLSNVSLVHEKAAKLVTFTVFFLLLFVEES